jgi:hypothetical protein
MAKLTAAQTRYWQKKMPGASERSIRIARAKQQAQHNPEAYGPGTNLTPIQLKQQVDAAAQEKYGQPLRQIGTSLSQVDPVYDAYRTSLANAATTSAQGYSDAATATNTLAGNINTADTSQRAQMLAKMQQDAAARGGTVDPSAFGAAQDAASSRATVAGTDAHLAQVLGANQQAFFDSLKNVSNLARENRRQTLQGQQQGLEQEQGAYKETTRQDLINQAISHAINYGNLGVSQQNAQTAAGVAGVNAKLGAAKVKETGRHNVASEKNTSAKNRHDAMLGDEKFQLDSQKYGSAQAKDAYQRAHGLGPYKKGGKSKGSGTTHTQRVSADSQYQQALSLLRVKTKGNPNIDPQAEADLIQTSQHKIAPDLALAAGQYYKSGGVDPKLAQSIFNKYGIRVPVKKLRQGAAPRNPNERPT